MAHLAELSAATAADPLLPRVARVLRRRRNLPDTVTLDLVPADGAPLPSYLPGQFTMLYAFGVGEIAVSISGDSADTTRLVQTIRAVGPVSTALTKLRVGDMLGFRGPYGSAWPMAAADGQDVVVMAGGLGLAP
jgi:NAD(P)H-flavin reductase